MTTVCYRDGVMAADTAAFTGEVYSGVLKKIAKAPDGTLGGYSGLAGCGQAFWDWLDSGMLGPCPATDDATFIMVSPSGEVSFCEGGSVFRIDGPYFAIGSGGRVALGAMAAGATAEEALLISCRLDPFSRLPSTILKLGSAET